MQRTNLSARHSPVLHAAHAFTLMCGLATASLAAQEGSAAGSVGTAGPAHRQVGADLDIPMPPRAVVQGSLSPHNSPPLPIGNGTLPQPDSPPAPPTSHGGGPGAPCSPIAHTLTQVSTPSGLRSTVGEPSVAVRAPAGASTSTAFVSHNWHAARSTNSGSTFGLVNPFTKFPAYDGGFCCDQRVIYSPEYDITIWFLQYIYSPSTQQGSVVIAVSVGNNVNAGSSGTWHWWVLNPGSFGIAAGNWLDYPDITVTDRWLFCSSNVYDGATDAYRDSVIWKMPLAGLQAGGSIFWNYWRTTVHLGNVGFSYRFAQGPGGTMYAAAHRDNTTIRLYRLVGASTNMSWVDRTIPAWRQAFRGQYLATAPNGLNWLAFVDSRITGGYVNADEYGFMWTAAQDASAGRPLPYVRIARFRISDQTLIGTRDIWSSGNAYAYPACATNLAGHVGVVMAQGEGNGNAAGVHPSTFFFTQDQCSSFDGGQWFSFGSASPTLQRWGDYFSVQQDPVRPMKFVGVGMSMAGGGGNDNQRIHYVRFGREQDNLAWVSTDVRSTPVSGVTVNCTTDNLGKTSLLTEGYVSYGPNSTYTLTAPQSFVSGGTVYGFERWRYNADWRAPVLDRTSDLKTLTVNNGTDDDRAVAAYQQATRVFIGSRNPGSGISIDCTQDVQGNQGGTTPFQRYYRGFFSEQLAVTAPATNGSQQFNRWYLNGVAQPQGVRTLFHNIFDANDVTVEAEYCTYTPGDYLSYGGGCGGMLGVPTHFANTQPDRGEKIRYEVIGAQPNTSAALYLGFSDTFWNGFPLPLCLGFIGTDPSCCVVAEGFVVLPFTIDGTGRGFKDIQTSDVSMIGMRIYTQTTQIDFTVPWALKISMSNGLRTTLGGHTCN